MKPPSILLVGNNTITRHLLRDILMEAGYRVVEVDEKPGSIIRAVRTKIDLVLLDLNLHDGQGYDELIRQLRLARGGGHLSILGVVGAVDTGADQERVDQADVTDYIVKPVNPRRLLEMVRMYLPHHNEDANSGT